MLILVAFAVPSGLRGVSFTVVVDACRILSNSRDGNLRLADADVDLIAPDNETQVFYGLATTRTALLEDKHTPSVSEIFKFSSFNISDVVVDVMRFVHYFVLDSTPHPPHTLGPPRDGSPSRSPTVDCLDIQHGSQGGRRPVCSHWGRQPSAKHPPGS
jgi:hypothetical protein